MRQLATVRQLRPTILIGGWVVPPEHRGQLIEVAYATCGWWIYRRADTLGVRNYHRADARRCKAADFEPWKRSPQVPESRWRPCTAEQAGDAS